MYLTKFSNMPSGHRPDHEHSTPMMDGILHMILYQPIYVMSNIFQHEKKNGYSKV